MNYSLDDYKKLSNLLKKYGIRPKKKLGQNFITDWDILEKLAKLCKITPQTGIIEIGSGIGNFTACLSKYCKKLYAVEIDPYFKRVHDGYFSESPNVEFIYDDFLEVDLGELINNLKTKHGCDEVLIIGNIPYNITGPIFIKISPHYKDFRNAYLTIQKEVAERLSANEGSKDYGIFSIKVQYFFKSEMIYKINKASFLPIPEVDSALLKLTPKAPTYFNDSETERKFFKFIDAAFSQRRKTLYNSLSSKGYLSEISREDFYSTLKEMGLPEMARPEQVSIERFLELFKKV